METYAVHEGQTAEDISNDIAFKYNLPDEVKNKILLGIKDQLKNTKT